MSPQHSITIHYCSTCQVGIDAEFSRPLACPRCGQPRKRLRSYQWSLREIEPAGQGAELPIELASVFEDLTTQ
jgi:hypothetical protein